MQTSEQLGDLAGALAVAQGLFGAVERNREVEVTMRSGGKYKFSYSTLDVIAEAVRKPLSENGIAWAQGVNGSENGTVVETLIMHKSGQWFKTVTPVRIGSGDNAAQALGSGISYAKRYGLTAALGVVTEDDDDGNGADGNEVTVKDTGRPKSNRSADDPNWTGPLAKSALKEKVRALAADVDNCIDDSMLIALLDSSRAIVNQCARDMPDWWMHKNGGNVGGLKQAIHLAGQQLKVDVAKRLADAESSKAPSVVSKQAAE